MADIYLPRHIKIGAGAVDELGAMLRSSGLERPFIVTDAFLASNGALDRATAALEREGLSWSVFADAVPDPTVASVHAALNALARGDHDCIIGFGGGSPIDTAKAAAVMSRRVGPLSALKAPHQEDTPALPIVAVPTTAGTGSEATRFTIITDEQTSEKMLCVGLAYLPVLAVVDYTLTLTKPKRLTADTGIDSLTHAIEAFVSRRASAMSDTFALSAMTLIWRSLRTACDSPGDHAAREAMMLGAHQAGIAFSNASVALVHAMSRPIGAFFHVPHGLSNAMLLPAVTAFSAAQAGDRYAVVARTLGIASPQDDDRGAVASLLAALEQLNRDLEVPSPRLYGIDQQRWFDLIPTMVEQAIASGSPANNPRVPERAQIADLYRQVWA